MYSYLFVTLFNVMRLAHNFYAASFTRTRTASRLRSKSSCNRRSWPRSPPAPRPSRLTLCDCILTSSMYYFYCLYVYYIYSLYVPTCTASTVLLLLLVCIHVCYFCRCMFMCEVPFVVAACMYIVTTEKTSFMKALKTVTN